MYKTNIIMTEVVFPGKYNLIVRVTHRLDSFRTITNLHSFIANIKEKCEPHDLAVHIKSMILQRNIILPSVPACNITDIALDSYGKVIDIEP